MPLRERTCPATVIELIRMRCRRCAAPWCRTPAAPRDCPFCGHTETAGAVEVLAAAFPRRRARARSPLDVFATR